jgi:hypothetical protein
MPPEMRVKVAEACFPPGSYSYRWKTDGDTVFDETGYRFDPKGNCYQKDALTCKCAELIYELPRNSAHEVDIRRDRFSQLGIYIATNNVLAIEELCAELLETNNG